MSGVTPARTPLGTATPTDDGQRRATLLGATETTGVSEPEAVAQPGSPPHKPQGTVSSITSLNIVCPNLSLPG